jgi:uncharacterized membrane protein
MICVTRSGSRLPVVTRALGILLMSIALHAAFTQWNGSGPRLLVLRESIICLMMAPVYVEELWVSARWGQASGWLLGIIVPLAATGWVVVQLVIYFVHSSVVRRNWR